MNDEKRGKGWVHWSLSAAFCLLRQLVILWFDPLFGGESLENWGYRNKSSWWSFEIRCGGSIRLNALCDAINSQLKMQLNTHQLQHPRFNSLMIWFNNKPIQNLLAIYMSEGTEIRKERINQSIDQTNVNKPSGKEKKPNGMESIDTKHINHSIEIFFLFHHATTTQQFLFCCISIDWERIRKSWIILLPV